MAAKKKRDISEELERKLREIEVEDLPKCSCAECGHEVHCAYLSDARILREECARLEGELDEARGEARL